MIELSNERIDEILHKETKKTEELTTILRAVYTRYMCLYEKYFYNIDALNDEKIAELKEYQEETMSLIKYYYLDIPEDVCTCIIEFNKEYGDHLLGSGWHEYVFGSFNKFKAENKSNNKSEEVIKADFSKHSLETFYEAMDEIFRDSFSTGSKAEEDVASGIKGILFGE